MIITYSISHLSCNCCT
uniref:Uncharacterized protein n=1 Tax=Anguilla anguilla TaxID=7936 RepID=A0A0E9TKC9_ANGAN